MFWKSQSSHVGSRNHGRDDRSGVEDDAEGAASWSRRSPPPGSVFIGGLGGGGNGTRSAIRSQRSTVSTYYLRIVVLPWTGRLHAMYRPSFRNRSTLFLLFCCGPCKLSVATWPTTCRTSATDSRTRIACRDPPLRSSRPRGSGQMIPPGPTLRARRLALARLFALLCSPRRRCLCLSPMNPSRCGMVGKIGT